jgi:predicted Zn-dependent protease with MMP-like domain
VDRDAFERLVADALEAVPPRFRREIDNLVILVEDEPTRELLRQMRIEPPGTLLGLYTGTPLTGRGWDYGNTLPDRILLFQGPLERSARTRDELVRAVAETLIHEIGHHFGMSEQQIADIERRYWSR